MTFTVISLKDWNNSQDGENTVTHNNKDHFINTKRART